jgi:hypothetical protein
MYLATQFSIFMVNKPGVLAQVLNAFAEGKVNIRAITMMDSAEHGVMRIVGESTAKVRKVLTKLNMQYGETDVLCVSLSNQAGALAKVTQKLSEAHINISYAYCTAGAKGGRTTGVLKVADVEKAMRILKAHADKRPKSKPKVRRAPSSRK